MKKVIIASSATNAKLHEPDTELKLAAQKILSYAVQGAEHVMSFKTGAWDGRSSFFDYKSATFPAGFVHYLSAALRQQGYEVSLVRKPRPAPLGPEKPVVDKFGDDPRYDYQPDIVQRLVKHGQMIAQVATGGGKSRIAKMVYARIGRPMLFLTTRSILMYQMKTAFERDMGVNVSVLGDGQFGHTIVREDGTEQRAIKKVCVGMVQTLAARLEEKTVQGEIERLADLRVAREVRLVSQLRTKLKGQPTKAIEAQCRELDKRLVSERLTAAQMTAKASDTVAAHNIERQKTIKVLSMFELVIGEEAHEISGSSYYNILKHCNNAHYRLALTATPFMKDDEESNMRLMAAFGPIGARVTEKTLIDRGILAAPHFKIVPLPAKIPKLHRMTAWQSAYRIGIVDCEQRNAAIVKECIRAKEYALPTLVLINQTKHGDVLLELLRAAGVVASFIQGEDDQPERQSALHRLAKGEIDVLIGSTILDVGVDVPAIGMVILAGGGKAEVALRQRIGRGAREKKVGPNIVLIVDFADDGNQHLKSHALQRQAIIKATDGFHQNLLPIGQDFDFDAMGLQVGGFGV